MHLSYVSWWLKEKKKKPQHINYASTQLYNYFKMCEQLRQNWKITIIGFDTSLLKQKLILTPCFYAKPL